nr:MAG TPA: hypothetical protein [Caudoviricetes sp.]
MERRLSRLFIRINNLIHLFCVIMVYLVIQ